MKTIEMSRNFTYAPAANVHIQYRGGATYDRVPESAVRAIIAANAGKIIERDV